MDATELDALDGLLETYTIEQCDAHLASHDNCAGCPLFLGDGEEYEAYCAADKVRAAVIGQQIKRQLSTTKGRDNEATKRQAVVKED